MPRGTFTDEELEHAAGFITRAVADRFGGNESRAASAFGCDPSTLNKIKAGTRKPVAIVAGVARSLGVSIDEILGRVPETVPKAAELAVPVLGPRYPSRADAIERILESSEFSALGVEKVEKAADAVAVALDSDQDPGFGWWFDQIRRQLRLWRRGKEELGVRELEDD